MNIKYAVVRDIDNAIVSDVYTRKGDAQRYLERWSFTRVGHRVATIELVIKEENK